MIITGRPPKQQAIAIETGVPKGFQQLSVTGTAGGLTVPIGANRAIIEAEGNSIRWRDDGTAPTSTVGMLYFPGTILELNSKESLANYSVIEDSNADGSVSTYLNISYYYKP